MERGWSLADMGFAPDNDFLDKLAEEFRDNCTRSAKDCKEKWICPCGENVPPVRNLLVDLPAYCCPKCKFKNPACYNWSSTKTKINGISLDFMVYHQYQTPYCTLFAVIAAFDSARRIDGALHRLIESAPLDFDEFKDRYESETNCKMGFETRDIVFAGFDNIPSVLSVLQRSGISIFSGTFYDAGTDEEDIPRLFIKDYFLVDSREISYVTRLIASGIPLVTSVRVGDLFELVSANEVYSAPANRDDANGNHSVALVGSGRAEKSDGQVGTFYVARNSDGERAHSRYHTKRFGGDFLVWAEDVNLIWGFNLQDQCQLEDDVEQLNL